MIEVKLASKLIERVRSCGIWNRFLKKLGKREKVTLNYIIMTRTDPAQSFGKRL